MVFEIVFCSEFPDIPDNAGKFTRRRRRRTQTIAKRYAFHANAIINVFLNVCFFALKVMFISFVSSK